MFLSVFRKVPVLDTQESIPVQVVPLLLQHVN